MPVGIVLVTLAPHDQIRCLLVTFFHVTTYKKQQFLGVGQTCYQYQSHQVRPTVLQTPSRECEFHKHTRAEQFHKT